MAAYYTETLENHQETSEEQIHRLLVGEYINNHPEVTPQQNQTWKDHIKINKEQFKKLLDLSPEAKDWGVLYEYNIPRRSKRIDVVLLSKNVIYVIEFKDNSTKYSPSDIAQVEDYCLDLRDFHFESKDRIIVPILLCSDAASYTNNFSVQEDAVQNTVLINKDNLGTTISRIQKNFPDNKDPIQIQNWNESRYLPTPTIIEAAQSLYAGQGVNEISRSRAGGRNLTDTTNAVLEAIENAQKTKSKIICFITGVPGAGKTLAGLNIVHSKGIKKDEKNLSVFLSGNGPLVKILTVALARDFARREHKTLREATRQSTAFIQNVHVFLDAHFGDEASIPEAKVVLFDEAQRAWDARQSNRKFQRNFSESEMMLKIMNRHKDWSVIVALIGGGQEINSGEAGLAEWGKTILDKYPDWKIYVSLELLQGEHATGDLSLFQKIPQELTITKDENLHLKVNQRSYRAKELSDWVNFVLNGNNKEATALLKEKLGLFPIFITRDLEITKSWLRARARGTRRIGLIASSGGRRLRAYGLDVKAELDEAEWFLNPKGDVRSSFSLELPATEFSIQGLEIDWSGVCWDGDLSRSNNQWRFKQFKGTKWQNANSLERQRFILNKYRVLLTRAREGLVIWVPKGNGEDKTRPHELYNGTFNYLKSCGIPILRD